MKKILVIILLLFGIITLINGQEILGSGTKDDPYQISELDHLLWLTHNDEVWHCYFVQTADIDMADTRNYELRDHDNNPDTPDSTMGFLPIGNSHTAFKGNYDGQNYCISNLYINRPNSTVGLFGRCVGSNFKNIILRDAEIKGMYAGSICGKTDASNISQCYSNAKLTAIEKSGGICYLMVESSIQECTFAGEIRAKIAGGIVCDHTYSLSYITLNQRIFSKCLSDGYIFGYESSAGIVNLYRGETSKNCNSILSDHVTDNISKSIVISDNKASGIAIECHDVLLKGNINKGIVAGENTAGLLYHAYNSCISKCSSIGDLGSQDNVVISEKTAGLVFNSSENTISECYIAGNLWGRQDVSGLSNYSRQDSIVNSYCSADFKQAQFSAGLIFQIDSGTYVGNYLFTGKTDTTNSYNPMLFSQMNNNNIMINCLWDASSSGINSFIILQKTDYDKYGRSHEEMTRVSTFTSFTMAFLDYPFDFVDNPFDDTNNEDIWNIDPEINNGYPYLVNNPPVSLLEDNGVTIEDSIGFTLPEIAEIMGNFPNPFNPSTTFKLSLVEPATIEIDIYNIKGQKVKTIDKGQVSRGYHDIVWNGDNNNNNPVASGVYFYNIKINGKSSKIRKCMLLK